MRGVALYGLAAAAEIAGCFAVWVVVRDGRSLWWLAPGFLALALFAALLALTESTAAGRAFAAYGGVYVAASLVWLFAVERVAPDRWDLLGGAICLVGAAVVLFGPR